MTFLPRVALIAGLSLPCALVAQAQTVPADAPVATATTTKELAAPLLMAADVPGKYKSYLYQRYAADKQARAVIHMFGRKQTGGALWLLSGATFIGFVTTQTGTKTTSSGTTTTTVTPFGYVLLTGLFGGVGVGKLSRFGNAELYKTLLAYDKSQTLPKFITTRIKQKDYTDAPVAAAPATVTAP